MATEMEMQHIYADDSCQLRLFLPPKERYSDSRDSFASSIHGGTAEPRRVAHNVRNCDIFVSDHDLLFCADMHLFKFHATRMLMLDNMKNIVVKFNTTERYYELLLPCVPELRAAAACSCSPTAACAAGAASISDALILPRATPASSSASSTSARAPAHISYSSLGIPKKLLEARNNLLDIQKLKRITDQCQLRLDNSKKFVKFEANFGYGFASRFKCNDARKDNSGCKLSQPHLVSPVQRQIECEMDEMQSFSKTEYNMNMIELQVPEGHDSPMDYEFTFEECTLTAEEKDLLQSLTQDFVPQLNMPKTMDQLEVDYGLVDILFAICYDVRTTSNDPTCESGWTRATLSATLSYFVVHDNLRSALVSFQRRALTYPLYRNYELGRLCIEDAVYALRHRPTWVMKQLLLTHKLFAGASCNRGALNRLYVEDYIRYVFHDLLVGYKQLRLLGYNVKNVLCDMHKTHLRMNLMALETQMFADMMELERLAIAISNSVDREVESNEDSDIDNGDDCDEDIDDDFEESDDEDCDEQDEVEDADKEEGANGDAIPGLEATNNGASHADSHYYALDVESGGSADKTAKATVDESGSGAGTAPLLIEQVDVSNGDDVIESGSSSSEPNSVIEQFIGGSWSP